MTLKLRQILSFSIIYAMMIVWLAACGDDMTNENITQIEQEGVVVVADESNLPDCTSESEGQQALIKDEPSPRICVDGNWLATYLDYTDKLDDFKCSAEKLKDGRGLKILCNGDSIGILLNGANGSSGINGTQGIQGEKGDKGDTGALGIQGEKGDKGDTGEQGAQGEKGDKGDTGEQGVQGEKGDKGDTGEQGAQGEKGDKGDAGEQGVQGEKGDKGDRGEQGAQGEKGDKGDTGEQGIQGEKGEKGDTGSSCSVNRVNDFIMITCGEKRANIDINEIMDTYNLDFCSAENEGVVVKKYYSPSQDSVYRCQNGAWVFSLELAYGTLIDERDQKIYKTIVIGNQVWMAENLNYAYLQPQGQSDSSSYCFNDIPENCDTFGRLYSWTAAMDSAGVFSLSGKGCGLGVSCSPSYPVRGVCPEGWHLPDSTEWRTLYNFMNNSSYAMQMKGVKKWVYATNAYGFSAIPMSNGRNYAEFWSSTDDKKENYGAYYWRLDPDEADLLETDKENVRSVRCVKNSD